MIYTSLAEIRSFDPCQEGWERLLGSLYEEHQNDDAISLEHILDSNGLEDTLWCLCFVDLSLATEFVQWCSRPKLSLLAKNLFKWFAKVTDNPTLLRSKHMLLFRALSVIAASNHDCSEEEQKAWLRRAFRRSGESQA